MPDVAARTFSKKSVAAVAEGRAECGMKTTPLNLRTRIIAACDAGKSTRAQVARRYRVSLGMVKKLLAQRQATGDIAAQHHRSGSKPKILETHRARMRELLARKPGLTLAGLRKALALACTLQAIHHALAEMGLTRKDRNRAPGGSTVPQSRSGARRNA